MPCTIHMLGGVLTVLAHIHYAQLVRMEALGKFGSIDAFDGVHFLAADFPGGDARTLYQSARRLLSLPPETRLFMCHDYLPAGRTEYVWETTVGAERAANVHIHDGIVEDDFVAMREARDKTLAMPRLILPSVQVNMRAGHMPPPDDNGVTYLKIPVNAV